MFYKEMVCANQNLGLFSTKENVKERKMKGSRILTTQIEYRRSK